MFVRHRQPWLAVAETGVRTIVVPGHRRAAAVAALERWPERLAIGILQCLERHVGLGEAQLLALVQADGAAQRTHQRHQLLGQCVAGDVTLRIAAPARDRALYIVVGNRPARPAFGHLRLERFDRGADVGGTALLGQQLEAVTHVQAAFVAVLGGGRQRILGGNFAERAGIRVTVQQGAHVFQQAEVLRLRVVVVVILERVGIVRAEAAAGAQLRRLGRVVAQLRVVVREVDRVQAEAVDAAIQPEPQVVDLRRAHLGIVEIEVGLRGQEIVQVVLPAPRLPFPGDAAEDRQPVVGRRAIRLRIRPHEPVRLWVVAAGAALAEPLVVDRAMAEHLVDHHLQAQRMRLGEQAVEVPERAEQRIDVAEIGDVVAEVGHRRLEERRDPDRIDTERGDVVQALDDARQVAHAVAIRVEETARIHLVHHRAAPPPLPCHSRSTPMR